MKKLILFLALTITTSIGSAQILKQYYPDDYLMQRLKPIERELGISRMDWKHDIPEGHALHFKWHRRSGSMLDDFFILHDQDKIVFMYTIDGEDINIHSQQVEISFGLLGESHRGTSYQTFKASDNHDRIDYGKLDALKNLNEECLLWSLSIQMPDGKWQKSMKTTVELVTEEFAKNFMKEALSEKHKTNSI